jgi:archaetidylinositol phosphate synthase
LLFGLERLFYSQPIISLTIAEKGFKLLTKLKKKIQQMLTGVAEAAHKIGLTPNKVTIIGFVLAFLSAVVYAITPYNPPLLLVSAIILLLASGFCDTLDGILARTYQQATTFGGFLDSLLDRYADVAIYAGVIISGLCQPIWGLAALGGAVLVSYSRARAEAEGVKMESVGFAERAERMLILAVVTLIAVFWLPALNYGIIFLAIISNLTVLQRALHVYGKLKKKAENA